MKFVIVFVALFAFAAAVDVSVLRQLAEVEPESYKFASELSDGSVFKEEGHLENVGKDDEGLAVRGKFSYVGPDGVTYTVSYIADKNGFQPSGDHLPVGPSAA